MTPLLPPPERVCYVKKSRGRKQRLAPSFCFDLNGLSPACHAAFARDQSLGLLVSRTEFLLLWSQATAFVETRFSSSVVNCESFTHAALVSDQKKSSKQEEFAKLSRRCRRSSFFFGRKRPPQKIVALSNCLGLHCR